MGSTFLAAVLLCTSIFSSVACQSTVTTYTPFQPLPTTPLPPVNSSGIFLWPITSNSQIFSAGSIMNISWTSEFALVNLWAVPNFNWDSPTSLASNTAATYFEWTMSCGERCEVPWLIRAVDANGDKDGQKNGGFVSAEFWIQNSKANTATRITASSAESTSMMSTRSATTTTKTRDEVGSISSSSTSTRSISFSNQDQGKTGPAEPAETSTAISTVPYSSPAAPSTSLVIPADDDDNVKTQSTGLGNQGFIGIGVGLGAAVLALTITLSWLLVRRRHKRKIRRRFDALESTNILKATHSSSKPSAGPFELPIKTPQMYHEAPGWSLAPQELHALEVTRGGQ